MKKDPGVVLDGSWGDATERHRRSGCGLETLISLFLFLCLFLPRS